MNIYPDNWKHLTVKNKTEEILITLDLHQSKKELERAIESKIMDLLSIFNAQVIQTIQEIETTEEMKKWHMKKRIEKIKKRIQALLSKKQKKEYKVLSAYVAWNCSKLLQLSNQLEVAFPPIFANLIVNPMDNGWFRVMTLALRASDSWKTNFDIENIIGETLHNLT